MRKYLKILSYLLFISFVLFACKKDEEKMLSTEESKNLLSNVSSQMQVHLDEISNNEGLRAINDLNNLDLVLSNSKEFSIRYDFLSDLKNRIIGNRIKKITKQRKASESLDFNSACGTYIWDANKENWDIKAGNPSNEIVIIYPTASSIKNNARLTISDYQELQFTDEWGIYYSPTKIKAELNIDEQKQFSIDFVADYNAAGEPQNLTAYIYLNPLDLSLNLNESGTNMSIDIALKLQDVVLMSYKGNILFSSIEKTDILNIKGNFQSRQLLIKSDINVAALLSNPQPSVESLNANINIELYSSDNSKIGKVELDLDVMQQLQVYIVFNDETKELANQYFDEIIYDFAEFIDILNDSFDK